MKFNKIFAIALAALTMTACSDDDENLNSASDVTVNMAKTSMEVRENGSIFNVMMNVTGEANGPIVVYVETTPTETDPAVADENYIVTSQKIIIPAGETSAGVEISPIDNDEENETRTFNVTITRVEGGAVGDQATCTVGLRDNDSDPYEKMTGQWTMQGSSVFGNGTDGPFTLTVQTPDPEEEAEYYGHELYGLGLSGYDFMYLPLSFAYNEITDEITLEIMTGEFATTGIINFGFNGVVVGSSVYAPGQMEFGENIPLTHGIDEAAGIEYYEADPEAMFLLAVLPYPSLDSAKGYFDGWDGIRIERPLR